MKELPLDRESDVPATTGGQEPWIEPLVSEARDLIGYPDGLILQGGSGII